MTQPWDAYRVAFRVWFGLCPREVQTLIDLYAAAPAPLSADELRVQGRHKSIAVVWNNIGALRDALEVEAIDFVPGAGYRLTESGVAECRAALWTMGEELRRAS